MVTGGQSAIVTNAVETALMVGYALSEKWQGFDYDQTKLEPKSRCQVASIALRYNVWREKGTTYLQPLQHEFRREVEHDGRTIGGGDPGA